MKPEQYLKSACVLLQWVDWGYRMLAGLLHGPSPHNCSSMSPHGAHTPRREMNECHGSAYAFRLSEYLGGERRRRAEKVLRDLPRLHIRLQLQNRHDLSICTVCRVHSQY